VAKLALDGLDAEDRQRVNLRLDRVESKLAASLSCKLGVPTWPEMIRARRASEPMNQTMMIEGL